MPKNPVIGGAPKGKDVKSTKQLTGGSRNTPDFMSKNELNPYSSGKGAPKNNLGGKNASGG